jgi:hypothetical protein
MAAISAVTSRVVGRRILLMFGDVRELNERISDISDRIHDWGGLCRANSPKVMGERENRPPVRDCAKLPVHRVV